ncbi:hypothetical protein LTR94_036347, partial [Friedmanniomyces endolithicus]
PLRCRGVRRSRSSGRSLCDRWRRILRRRRPAEGRAGKRRRDHHRQPHLCARNPRPGVRHGAGGAGRRACRTRHRYRQRHRSG